MDVCMSDFARAIMEQKYSHTLANGAKETWPNIAHRVTKHVMRPIGYSMRDKLSQDIRKAITERKILPAGRYLYSAGRSRHMIGNCLALDVYDSREGWCELLHKASMALMTGAGVGVNYSKIRPEGAQIRGTGGIATGPLALMRMLNECGRGIMQGGARRSALWGGLVWDHSDTHKFIQVKNWPQEVRDLKAKDFNFPATLDQTNISVCLNDEFFVAYHDEEHPKHSLANSVYWAVVERMLKTGEPGFAVNVGRDRLETLANAPVSGGTRVLAYNGYMKVIDIVDKPVTVWTGEQWTTTTFKRTKINVQTVTVKFTGGEITCDPSHEFLIANWPDPKRLAASKLQPGTYLHRSMPFGAAPSPALIKVLEVCPGPVEDVYCCDVGVKEHSFCAEGVIISNCTEFRSSVTDTPCNLASLNLARINTIEEFEELVELATVLLLAGSVYGDVPYSDVDKVRTQDRRLGLGLMGVHEWLLQRGKSYAPDDELWQWLKVYTKSTGFANSWADEFEITRPKKTRAVAPTGTISIIAETTGGIEPIFCAAYKRRYLKGSFWHYQYVVDPTAKRLIESGVKPDMIEDAYDLSRDTERRVKFQHWFQQSVDMAISSTINLPVWGSEENNDATVRPFGDMLMKYLPGLRGITTYPDGARAGQPLVPVPYEEAVEHAGMELVEESVDVCSLRGGSCND